ARQGHRAAGGEKSRVTIANRNVRRLGELVTNHPIHVTTSLNHHITRSAILKVRLSRYVSMHRRVAQRLERLLDTQEVGGSSPPVPTNLRRPKLACDRARAKDGLRLASRAKVVHRSGEAAKVDIAAS